MCTCNPNTMEVFETITGLLQVQRETRSQGNKVESDVVMFFILWLSQCVDVHTYTHVYTAHVNIHTHS